MSFGSIFRERLGLVFRQWLQADHPTPDHSEAEFAQEVERHYRWNFTVNTLEAASFFLAVSLISGSTIVPLFISKLTPSPIPIGIAAFLAQGAWYLPQLFTANLIEQLPLKKPIVVKLGFFLERLPLCLLILSAYLTHRSYDLALVVFLIGYGWWGFGSGMIATGWQDLIARCFPVERRGRFLGISSFIGTGMGVAGAGLSTWVLSTCSFPNNFLIIFILATGFVFLSLGFLALTREPVYPSPPSQRTQREFLSSLPDIFRHKHNFRRFLIARSLLTLGSMGLGFITLSAIRIWSVDDSTVGLYTAFQLLSQGVGTLLLGLLADRKGHKLALELSALFYSLAFFLALIAPNPDYYHIVFLLLGLANGGLTVSGLLMVLEFAEPERLPTYAGIVSSSSGIIATFAPMLGALLASTSFLSLFAISATLNLMAMLMLIFGVQEPRFAQSE